jgi:hypothetical protein
MNKTKLNSIGREAAIALADSGWWKDKGVEEICDVQLFTEELCMPFSDFHKAITEALGRPVYTHEFGLDYDGLVAEYLGDRAAPTLEQIIGLLPADKTILACATSAKDPVT